MKLLEHSAVSQRCLKNKKHNLKLKFIVIYVGKKLSKVDVNSWFIWMLWSQSCVHLKVLSLSLSLSSLCLSFSGCELWFFALLSLLSSLTMRNSVCSRDGGGADTDNDTGKEGKNSQLSSIREKKNESDRTQRENTLEWVGWTGGLSILKSKGLSRKKTSKTSHCEEPAKKSCEFWFKYRKIKKSFFDIFDVFRS